MKQYHEHLRQILDYGTPKPSTREGLPCSLSLFSYQNRYSLRKGFPIVTTREIKFEHIVTELLWLLKGDTNIRYLVDNKCNTWNKDAYNYYVEKMKIAHAGRPHLIRDYNDFMMHVKNTEVAHNQLDDYEWGDCGHLYGRTWRSFGNTKVSISQRNVILEGVDQITRLIYNLKNNPQSRRLIISSLDIINDNDLASYWCHCLIQFNCRPLNNNDKEEQEFYLDKDTELPKYFLDCHLYQRSADMFLRVPFSISSYSLLTHILAYICNMIPGEFIHSFGDSYIYDNHLYLIKELLSRSYNRYNLPTLTFSTNFKECINKFNSGHYLDDMLGKLDCKDITLKDYQHYPAIKATDLR